LAEQERRPEGAGPHPGPPPLQRRRAGGSSGVRLRRRGSHRLPDSLGGRPAARRGARRVLVPAGLGGMVRPGGRCGAGRRRPRGRQEGRRGDRRPLPRRGPDGQDPAAAPGRQGCQRPTAGGRGCRMSKEDRKARFRQKMKQTAEANGHPGEGDELARLATTRLDGVKPLSVRYLVPGYIPRGKLVLLAGDGGHGKSLITLHLIACLTTGRPCFGLEYEPLPPCEALIVCCEDDYGDTVVPRLIAAGADLSKVYSVDGVKSKDGKPTPFSLAHYEAVERELES